MSDLQKMIDRWRIQSDPYHQKCADELEQALSAQADVHTIDLDATAWEEILKSASESKWMPAEYMRNDWISDVCDFLRNGPEAFLSAQGEAVSALALKFLVASGFVTQAKADEAMTIASGYTHPAPLVEVDEAMVERAMFAYEAEVDGAVYSDKVPYSAMRAALTSALNPSQPEKP